MGWGRESCRREFAVCCFFTLAGMCGRVPAFAQVAQLNIPAGPANKSIVELAHQANTQILGPGELLHSVVTPEIKGTFDVTAALEMMLKETDLMVSRTAGGIIKISSKRDNCNDEGETMSRNPRNSVSLFALLLGAVTMPVCNAQSAAAQESETIETVTVTGTLLKGAAPVGMHVVDFDIGEIKATGATTVNEVLANIPQINSLFNVVPTTATAGLGHDTQPKPRLRNLNSSGGAATLVMVDSHNLVGDGVLATTPDPTSIPAMVLQRVDVVLDGGSAIYGSNAIAGVINLITRKDFEGVQVQAQAGTTTADNYSSYEVGLMAGHNWGSGGAYIAYEYSHHTNQLASELSYPRLYLVPLGGTRDARATACALANITADGTIYHQTTSAVANTSGALAGAVASGQYKCDTMYLGATIVPEDTQHSFFASLHEDITDSISFSVTANYSLHDTVGLSYAQSTTGSITSVNPYFQAIGTETKQTVSFSLEPVYGPYVRNTDRLEKFAITPVLNVRLSDDWDLEVLGNYGRSHVYQLSPTMNTVAVNAALQTSDANFALDPYNLALTPASVLENLRNFGTTGISTQELSQIRAIINGSLFSLPGGDVKLALGAQWDYETISASNVNGPLGQRGGTAVSGGLVIQADADREVYSTFAEVNIPIVGSGNEMSFVHSLALDVSVRYDNYSDVGGTTNPKIGVTYEPFAGFKLNGNIGTAFNAPSLADTTGATDTRVFVNDPPTNLIPGTTVPTGYVDVLIAGGSPDLKSQKANTWSAGFNYMPDFWILGGLDLNLTFWHVSLHNVIAQAPYKTTQLYTVSAYSSYYMYLPTLAEVEAATAGMAKSGFSDYESYANGTLGNGFYTLRDARRHNLGNVFDDGLDFGVNYETALDWGRVDFGINGSVYTSAKTQAYNGAAFVDQLIANTSPRNWSAHVGTSIGAFTARVTWNYSAGYTSTTTGTQTHIGSFSPVNLFASYDLADLAQYFQDSTIGVTVTNLFDIDPPFANNTTGGYANGSTLGRFVQFNISKKF